jgi:hypothetical protein
MLLASGTNFKETHWALKNMMERRDGIFNWSCTYNSPLEMNKLTLVDFTHSHEKAKKAKTLMLTQSTGAGIRTHCIKPSTNTKLLGVIFDEKLSWSMQHEKVHEKAIKWTAAFKHFTKAANGI